MGRTPQITSVPRPHKDLGIRNGGVIRDGRAASSGREGKGSVTRTFGRESFRGWDRGWRRSQECDPHEVAASAQEVRQGPPNRTQDSGPVREQPSPCLPPSWPPPPGARSPGLWVQRPIFPVLLHLYCVQLRALPPLPPSPQGSGCPGRRGVCAGRS